MSIDKNVHGNLTATLFRAPPLLFAMWCHMAQDGLKLVPENYLELVTLLLLVSLCSAKSLIYTKVSGS